MVESGLDGLLVALTLGGVTRLLSLVTQGILGSGGTSADGGVAVLGDVLVGLLGSTGGGLLDLLTDEVGALLDGIHYDGLGFGCLVWKLS